MNLVYEASLLSCNKVYVIDRVLYRFCYCDPYSPPNRPRYKFQPLGGQRRRSDLILSHARLTAKCYEVDGITPSCFVINQKWVQLSLF